MRSGTILPAWLQHRRGGRKSPADWCTLPKPGRKMQLADKVGILNRRTSAFVWAAWALLVLCAMVYVVDYGSNVPSWDDWDMVPTMTGNQPVTASWLWSQHNEHRVPLARLIMVGLYRLRPDFRVPMFFNVFLMAALSAFLIRCAQQ